MTYTAKVELSSSIGCQDQDDKREHELRDANDGNPEGLGGDVGSLQAILTAKGPGVIGEVDHVGDGGRSLDDSSSGLVCLYLADSTRNVDENWLDWWTSLEQGGKTKKNRQEGKRRKKDPSLSGRKKVCSS